MNPKLVFFVAFVVSACSAEDLMAARFPADVDPALCPGYPNCDNTILHVTEKVEVPELKAERFPADVDPALCPNYPDCDNTVLHVTEKVELVEVKPERFPAGVSPLACPGYPNCDNALLHGTEKIEVLPTYHKSIYPGYKYYGYNQLTHFADEYYPASPYVIPRTIAPIYRYAPGVAPVAPVVAPVVAPIAVAPVAPNTVHTINGSPVAPIAPFAALPGFASRLFTVFFVAFVVAACSAVDVPARYPAGVSPLACPGYPNCDNALLHGTEKIEVLPTYQKSLYPGYKYYSYNQLTHFADEYYPASPYVIPRTVAPIYRYAPVVAHGVAPIASVAPVAPNTVHTINGSPVAPIAPFATLPGLASKLLVRSY
ncbi:uncharacterized protein LOC129579887 [Sitodiplosis mosellana]|uniref:uncharacterized protein LOC129579885 n=1 Tax=Sitodiplosis mosellana TaxID=263140 RepID=UPI002443B0F8|nr:uncharacterized protein LOC129579885 [Sitodiplosis mosellana]XP_055326045.1 uncharacterized protein LOC129579887 [Sitodiplosis mosellana]